MATDGIHGTEIDLNGNPVSSGIYFYQLRADDFVQTKRMVLLH